MKIWAPVVLTASLLVSGSGTARAQANATPTSVTSSVASSTPAKPDYPGESYVFDQLNRIYTFAADGTGSRQFTGVIEIRNPAGVKALSILTFEFASSAEHVEIGYVRVRHTNGAIVSTPAADAQELPDEVTREAPFYSDLKQEQIPVRSLQPGDVLEYQIRIIRTKPEAPGHFWGGDSFFLPSSGIVIRSEVIELHVPKDAYVQVWSPNYKPTITNAPAERIYHWQSSQLDPVAGKTKNALLKLDNNPTLGTSDDPALPHIAWSNFHSWQEVGAWYRSLEGSRTQPDDDIRAKVATLIAGKSTPEDKAQAIYNFVSAQVRYIGVAFGVGRFQPHDAGDVLSNQYGDCKDKSTLLISMLSAAGINADAVLIGAGITFNPNLPSPGSFNHAITLAHIDGKPIWLDSTAEVSPYRLLNPIIRGKRALVIPATGDAHIETTPKDPPFPFLDTFEAIGSLDDKGTSHSHIVMAFRSDDEVTIRQAVRTVSPAQWDELMQRFSYAMGYSGKVTNSQFSRPEDTSTPANIAYDYEREKNGDWDNLRIIAQVPPFNLADVDEKDPPVTPIELGAPHTETAHAVMTLPKGWNADLPASIHNKTPFATLDLTYKLENGAIVTDRRLVILQQSIPASDWQAYHKWFTDSQINNQPFIQLQPSSTDGSVSSSADNNNPAAADLIRQAIQAEQRKDLSTARNLLDKAQALNANQPYLWSNYGYVAMQDHDTSDAITDCKKELAAHPDEAFVSHLLASMLMSEKKSADAIATLQTAIARTPTDESLSLMLASIYIQNDDKASAEKALRSSLDTNPTSANLKLQLGAVLLQDHKLAEGEPLLYVVLTTSTNPLQLNNAAYELANANLDLPLAETSSKHSLDLLDEASNNGETGPAALVRASLLVSAWDTYGWILLRENKVTEAEPWIRAAWRNGNSAETGYHLAVIFQNQHHPAQALEVLEQARSVERGAGTSVRNLIAQKETELAKSTSIDQARSAAASLQLARTYQLPRGNLKPTGQGWATVELNVTTQGTTGFRIVDGDQSLQPLTSTVQHLDLNLQLPSASHASLVRRGVLSCDTSSTCQLVLVSPQSALSN